MNLWNVLHNLITFPFRAAESLANKVTGAGLTGADREANAFTAEREDIAWSRQMEADNTKYQRSVADMQAAGINPILAAGGVTSAPSASSSGSVSPGSSNLGSVVQAIIQAKLAKSQDANIKAQTELTKAQQANVEANTDKTSTETDYFKRVQDIRAEGERLSNNLTNTQIRSIYKAIDEADSRINLNDKNALEAEARTVLHKQEVTESEARTVGHLAKAMLDRANAQNVAFLQPYVAAELSARSESERSQARFAAVQAAYQQGLIDNGMVEAAVRLENERANDAQVSWTCKEYQQGVYANSNTFLGNVTFGLFQLLNHLPFSASAKF